MKITRSVGSANMPEAVPHVLWVSGERVVPSWQRLLNARDFCNDEKDEDYYPQSRRQHTRSVPFTLQPYLRQSGSFKLQPGISQEDR
jgi:hypothetical protein